MAAGYITVPTYTTNTERDHQHILDNSGARAVIVSTAKLARALMPAVMRSNASLVISMESLRWGMLVMVPVFIAGGVLVSRSAGTIAADIAEIGRAHV